MSMPIKDSPSYIQTPRYENNLVGCLESFNRSHKRLPMQMLSLSLVALSYRIINRRSGFK